MANFLYNKQNNTRMRGNMKFISRFEQDISLVPRTSMYYSLYKQVRRKDSF